MLPYRPESSILGVLLVRWLKQHQHCCKPEVVHFTQNSVYSTSLPLKHSVCFDEVFIAHILTSLRGFFSLTRY